MESTEIFLSLMTNITFESEHKCYNDVWISKMKVGSVLEFTCQHGVKVSTGDEFKKFFQYARLGLYI